MGAEIPLQPVVKTMVGAAVPLQPMEDHGDAKIHLQPMKEPTLEQGGATERVVNPWETHAGTGTCRIVE
ncbi:protein pxr1-like [Pitangus sulphuratus]|nr:protein pxr1-like [Pitangus sulphuratus]